MSNVTAVVPTSVIKTESFNFVFMHQANFNYNGEPYGFFLFLEGQWEILVVKNDNIVVGESGDKKTITTLLRRDDLPDFVVLVEPADFESAKRILTDAGHQVTEHPHDGPLAMFGRA